MNEKTQNPWSEIERQSKLDFFHHSDRAAIDVGIAGLNAITLLNGGAIVALLAFVGQVWDGGKGAEIVKAIVYAGVPFGWGVVTAGASFFMAYFYQSSVTWAVSLQIEGFYNLPPTQNRLNFVDMSRKIWRLLMVAFSGAAVALFLWGVIRVSAAFLSFPI